MSRLIEETTQTPLFIFKPRQIVVEERAALPVNAGVKCRRPERVKTELYRSVPNDGVLWQNGLVEETM